MESEKTSNESTAALALLRSLNIHLEFDVGDKVEARHRGRQQWLEGIITGKNGDGTYNIQYATVSERNVPLHRIRGIKDSGLNSKMDSGSPSPRRDESVPHIPALWPKNRWSLSRRPQKTTKVRTVKQHHGIKLKDLPNSSRPASRTDRSRHFDFNKEDSMKQNFTANAEGIVPTDNASHLPARDNSTVMQEEQTQDLSKPPALLSQSSDLQAYLLQREKETQKMFQEQMQMQQQILQQMLDLSKSSRTLQSQEGFDVEEAKNTLDSATATAFLDSSPNQEVSKDNNENSGDGMITASPIHTQRSAFELEAASPEEKMDKKEISLGDYVEARFQGGIKWFPGRVIACHADRTFHIRYDDGDEELHVPRSFVIPFKPWISLPTPFMSENGRSYSRSEQTQSKQSTARFALPLSKQSTARFELPQSKQSTARSEQPQSRQSTARFEQSPQSKPSTARSVQLQSRQSIARSEHAPSKRSSIARFVEAQSRRSSIVRSSQNQLKRHSLVSRRQSLVRSEPQSKPSTARSVNTGNGTDMESPYSPTSLAQAKPDSRKRVQVFIPEEQRWLSGYIERKNLDGTFIVVFDNGTEDIQVHQSKMRLEQTSDTFLPMIDPLSLSDPLCATGGSHPSPVKALLMARARQEQLLENQTFNQSSTATDKIARNLTGVSHPDFEHKLGSTVNIMSYGQCRPGSIVSLNYGGTYDIRLEDGSKEHQVHPDRITLGVSSGQNHFVSQHHSQRAHEQKERPDDTSKELQGASKYKDFTMPTLDSSVLLPPPQDFEEGDVVKVYHESGTFDRWQVGKIVTKRDGAYDVCFNGRHIEKYITPARLEFGSVKKQIPRDWLLTEKELEVWAAKVCLIAHQYHNTSLVGLFDGFSAFDRLIAPERFTDMLDILSINMTHQTIATVEYKFDNGAGLIDYMEFIKYCMVSARKLLRKYDDEESILALKYYLEAEDTKQLQTYFVECISTFALAKAVGFKGMFRSIDFNGSGCINLGEFHFFMRRIHLFHEFKSRQISALFTSIDILEDGVIDYDEFMIFFILDENEKRLDNLRSKSCEEMALKSFFVFGMKSWIRRLCLGIINDAKFGQLVIAFILLNSIILALADYRYVDENGLTSDGSARNAFVIYTEPIFTMIFFLEFLIKAIATGFYFGNNAYLRDPWNVFDFVLVITSFIVLVAQSGNLSFLKAFRLLRPLRTLAKFPGLRKVINGLIASIKSMIHVLIFLGFIFSVFAIICTSFLGGKLHYRCRVTPFPVKMDSNCTSTSDQCWSAYIETVISSPDEFRCLNVENNDDGWSQASSPWTIRQDCLWPLDPSAARLCSYESDGLYHCSNGLTCGSNYDFYGNPRFVASSTPFGFNRMKWPTFNDDFNWGLTTFDNFAKSTVTLFQMSTLEGWTNIVYHVMDSVNGPMVALCALIFIFLTNMVAINLMLTFISNFVEDENRKEMSRKSLKHYILSKNSHIKDFKNRPHTISRFRRMLLSVVESSSWVGFVNLLIVLNTVVLALNRHSINSKEETILNDINTTVAFLFGVEMAFCICAYTPKGYIQDKLRLCDGIITISSLISEICELLDVATEFGVISVLRSLRLFRIFYLARKWQRMQQLLETMLKTFFEVGNFTVLLLLNIYIFALLGMSLFANTLHFAETGQALAVGDDGYGDAVIPRLHYQDILWASVSVFQVLTGENWNSMMYKGWLAVGDVAVLYYIVLTIVGSFILMNIFLAVLLSNLSNHDFLSVQQAALKPEKITMKRASVAVEPALARVEQNEDLGPESAPISGKGVIEYINGEYGPQFLTPRKHGFNHTDSNCSDQEQILHTKGITNTDKSFGAVTKDIDDEQSMSHSSKNNLLLDLSVHQPNRSCWIFSERNGIRKDLLLIVGHPFFDRFMLIVVLASSLSLALDNPLNNPNSLVAEVLDDLDWAFAAIFSAEMVMKMIATGVALHPNSYFRDPWNIMDFLILFVSWLDLTVVLPFSSLSALRVLRVLKPLRMIHRLPSLKRLVHILLNSIPTLIKMAFISSIFFFVFAIMGVSYYKGSLYSCQGDAFDLLSPEKVSLITYPVQWSKLSFSQASWFDGTACKESISYNPQQIPTSQVMCTCLVGEDAWQEVIPQNFNTVGHAMSLLYEISTTEGWSDVMLAVVDARGPGMQPVTNSNLWAILYFILFMLVGSFMITNLFVGVILDSFLKQGEKERTGDQQEELFQSQLKKIRPRHIIPRPSNCCGIIFDIVNNPRFEKFTMICIVANSIAMAVHHFGESDKTSSEIELVNLSFGLYFNVEAMMKLFAYKHRYFASGWNIFDFLVVIGTDIGLIFSSFTDSSVASIVAVVRVFRLCRLFRLIKAFKDLANMFEGLIRSLPAFFDIFLLLSIIFYIYTLIAIQSYAKVEANEEYYNDHANFRRFFLAFFTLLRFATGEDWNGFMYSISVKTDGCENDPEYNSNWCEVTGNAQGCTPINGCGKLSVIPFFYSFTLVIYFALTNLFIGVILECIDQNTKDLVISDEELQKLCKAWSEHDPDANLHLSQASVLEIVNELQDIFGIPPYLRSRVGIKQVFREMKLKKFKKQSSGRSEDTSLYSYEDLAGALFDRRKTQLEELTSNGAITISPKRAGMIRSIIHDWYVNEGDGTKK